MYKVYFKILTFGYSVGWTVMLNWTFTMTSYYHQMMELMRVLETWRAYLVADINSFCWRLTNVALATPFKLYYSVLQKRRVEDFLHQQKCRIIMKKILICPTVESLAFWSDFNQNGFWNLTSLRKSSRQILFASQVVEYERNSIIKFYLCRATTFKWTWSNFKKRSYRVQ